MDYSDLEYGIGNLQEDDVLQFLSDLEEIVRNTNICDEE